MKIKKIQKEIIAVISIIAVLILIQHKIWITHEKMVSHDSAIWYGGFAYFTDCLHQGFLPLWNPYMNSGENFFLNLYMLHLLDPSTLMLVFIGKILKINFFVLYHYDLLIRYLIFIVGAYLFFRYIAKYKISGFIAFAALTFSSLSVSYLKQHAFISSFYLLPWIVYVMLRLFNEQKAELLLLLAFLIGIALNSYHAAFVLSSVFILCSAIFLSNGLPLNKLKVLFTNPKVLFISALLPFLLVLHTIVAFFVFKNSIIPTLRMFEAPVGAKSFPADFLLLLNPFFMSESFLYIGLIPLFFAIIGVVYSRDRYKNSFIAATVITVVLMLGVSFNLLCKILLPLSAIRNTHTFGPLFLFCLGYFVCIGTDVIIDKKFSMRLIKNRSIILFLMLLICSLIFLSNFIFNTVYPLLVHNFYSWFESRRLSHGCTPQFFGRMITEINFKGFLNMLLFLGGCFLFYIPSLEKD